VNYEIRKQIKAPDHERSFEKKKGKLFVPSELIFKKNTDLAKFSQVSGTVFDAMKKVLKMSPSQKEKNEVLHLSSITSKSELKKFGRRNLEFRNPEFSIFGNQILNFQFLIFKISRPNLKIPDLESSNVELSIFGSVYLESVFNRCHPKS